MQRKNYLLRHPTQKSGIAIIMAITVLVIVGTIMALSLSLTNLTTKKTTDLYLYEQAVLLSQSASEYALLKLSQTNQCSIPNINFVYNTIYNVDIDIRYIVSAGTPCQVNAQAIGRDFATVVDPNTNGTVIMDITVSVPDNINVTTEPIRYFKRTIQKL